MKVITTKSKISTLIPRIAFLVVASFMVLAINSNLQSSNTSAQIGSSFDPGVIISDSEFTDYNSMTAAQIDSFLDQKMPDCDTWGQETVFKNGQEIKRADYKASNPPPFTCLRDYSHVTTNQSAGEIIRQYSAEYKINPRVLLVMLEKEQSLVTDDWPLDVQYQTAMGFACPDTAPCDPEYFGFKNQVKQAARLLRGFFDNDPYFYVPYTQGNRYVGYHPNASCGGSTVNIRTRAAAALYSYTPYQPNQAALNNSPGAGDSCSAYGNRNFHYLYTQWFGSSTATSSFTPGDLKASSQLKLDSHGVTPNETNFATFTIKNTSSSTLQIDELTIVARGENGQNLDYPAKKSIKLLPGKTYVYRASQKFNAVGAVDAWIGAKINGKWARHNVGNNNTKRVYVGYGVKQVESIKVTRNSGNLYTASFRITNFASQSFEWRKLKVIARNERNQNFDFATSSYDLLRSEDFLTYSKKRSLPDGKYTFWISYQSESGDWNKSRPSRLNKEVITIVNKTIR